MLAGAEGRASPDLEAGDGAKTSGQKPGLAGDDQGAADPEMKGGWLALGKFPDSALPAGLELPQRKNFRGVDLKDGGLAGALEDRTGERKLCSCPLASLKNVHSQFKCKFKLK